MKSCIFFSVPICNIFCKCIFFLESVVKYLCVRACVRVCAYVCLCLCAHACMFVCVSVTFFVPRTGSEKDA